MKQIAYDSELASPYREKYLSVMASSASMIQSILERILPNPADGGQTEPELDPVEGGPDE